MKNKKNRVLRIENNGPRPASGTGDVIVPFGDTGQEVILKWEKGVIVDVLAHPDNTVELVAFSAQLNQPAEFLEEGGTGIVMCVKCARDTVTGHVVCWDIPC